MTSHELKLAPNHYDQSLLASAPDPTRAEKQVCFRVLSPPHLGSTADVGRIQCRPPWRRSPQPTHVLHPAFSLRSHPHLHIQSRVRSLRIIRATCHPTSQTSMVPNQVGHHRPGRRGARDHRCSHRRSGWRDALAQ
ncbi:hypothetical protein OF83DRAFT_346543 [Amylostereum chailletii]|nr:hypothetical protein OF83DRAFT_346543 [Amylostereum chailletii]